MNPIGKSSRLVISLYLLATAISFGLVFAPSSVHTEYAWWEIPLWVAALVALVLRVDFARKLLILGGLLAAFGDLAVQASPLDAVATVRAAVELIGVGLLLTPAARRFTRGGQELVPDAPPAV